MTQAQSVMRVGDQFANRLTETATALTEGIEALVAHSGWDVSRKAIYAALPHDLRKADGWHILSALHAMRLPISLFRDEAPAGDDAPYLAIAPDGEWTVIVRGAEERSRRWSRGTMFVTIGDADRFDLATSTPQTAELFASLRSSYASLMISSLVVNILGISTVFFIILIYNFAVPALSDSVLAAILIGVVLVSVFEVIARQIRSTAIVRMAADLEHQLGLTLLYKLISLPLAMLHVSDVHHQRARLRHFESIRDAMLGPIGQSALDLPFLVLYGFVIFVLCPPVGWLLVGFGAVSLAVFAGFQPAIRRRLVKSAEEGTVFRKIVTEVVDHQGAIRGLGTQTIWNRRLGQAHARYLQSSEAAQSVAQATTIVLQGMILATGISGGVLATHLAMSGQLSLGALIGLIVLIWRFLMPIQSAAKAGEEIVSIIQSLSQIGEVLSISGESYRGVMPVIAPPVRPPVIFDQVTLRFTDSVVPPLLGASLKLDEETVTSVSGPTMSGKTKLAEMIAGFHAPTGGRLLINGSDVRQIPVDDLRAAIAFAPQEPELFYGSIAQNLDFAVPGATEDQMWAALLEAGIDQFVRGLPDQLSTRLSRDRFLSLPYGVRKGLALAQTFLRPGPIFIFDDPNAGLGAEQASFVRSAIRARRSRGCVLLLSNYREDIAIADRHILLSNGRVILNDRAERGRAKLEALLYRTEAA